MRRTEKFCTINFLEKTHNNRETRKFLSLFFSLIKVILKKPFSVYFSGNEITKVEGLQDCNELRELVLDKNKIKVRPLKQHVNPISDFRFPLKQIIYKMYGNFLSYNLLCCGCTHHNIEF